MKITESQLRRIIKEEATRSNSIQSRSDLKKIYLDSVSKLDEVIDLMNVIMENYDFLGHSIADDADNIASKVGEIKRMIKVINY